MSQVPPPDEPLPPVPAPPAGGSAQAERIGSGRHVLARVWGELEGDPRALDRVADPVAPLPLPSRLPVGELVFGAVGAASLAAATVATAGLGGHDAGRRGTEHRAGVDPADVPEVRLDPLRVAAAVASERLFALDGRCPDGWAPLSGFWAASDGWVRTHGNYPHHAAALRRALGLPDGAGREDVAAAIGARSARATAAAITATGGVAVVVDHEDAAADAMRATTPLLVTRRLGTAPPRPRGDAPPRHAPLRDIRVLDLTRVIAGPVAGRTLALLGAEVLRVDPPHPAEIEWQHLDTGHGKRSARLDAATADGRRRLERLLDSADAILLGYRSEALARLGLSPEAIAGRHPGIVVARLSAWGFDRPAAVLRGFDSIVQAASGISWIESADGVEPGALPAQLLDHSTGYLIAAAVIALLDRQRREGGSWLAETSLRRVAAELLVLPRVAETTGVSPGELASRTTVLPTELGMLRTALPAPAYDGGPVDFPAPPRPWGRDAPAWADRR